MPRLLNIRDLPGFTDRRPVIPDGAVYIGRPAWRYGLLGSCWANEPLPPNATDNERAHAVMEYETQLTCDAVRMDRLHELRGRDLVCWCSPKPCHGDVLLELANICSLADVAARDG